MKKMFDADMQNMNERKDRINIAYQYLRCQGIVHTQRDVSRHMGASPTNVSSALNGIESVLTDRFMLRFNHAFGDVFNINWLLSGVGHMFATMADESDINEMYDADIQKTDKRKERIANAFQYLRGQGIVHTQKDVSERMKASEGTVSCALKGIDTALTDRFFKRFNHAFGDMFNLDWLLTGVGDMLATTDDEADIQIDNNVIASSSYAGDSSINTVVAVLQKENNLLKEKVDLLERMLKEKDEIIWLLKDVVGLRKKDKNER